MSEDNEQFLYKHYKGGIYLRVGRVLSIHSEAYETLAANGFNSTVSVALKVRHSETGAYGKIYKISSDKIVFAPNEFPTWNDMDHIMYICVKPLDNAVPDGTLWIRPEHDEICGFYNDHEGHPRFTLLPLKHIG